MLSLLFCLAAAALWVRSAWASDTLRFQRRNEETKAYEQYSVRSFNGRGEVTGDCRDYVPRSQYPALGPWRVTYTAGPPWLHGSRWLSGDFMLSRRGQEVMRARPEPLGRVRERSRVLVLHFPHWAVVLALGTPPTLWWIVPRLRRCLRRRKGLCISCGYDLRGSTDKCPECGTPVPREAPPPSGGEKSPAAGGTAAA